MQTKLMRILMAVAAASSIGAMLIGCDGDNIEIVGIGVSTGLPGNTMTGSNEIGVGNVHWVGNPRW
jgi:hypothetical protein